MKEELQDDVTEKVIVTVFPTLSACGPSSSCRASSAGCGPSANPFSSRDPIEELSQRIEEIRETFGNAVWIETVDYETVSQLRHA